MGDFDINGVIIMRCVGSMLIDPMNYTGCPKQDQKSIDAIKQLDISTIKRN